MLLQLLCDNGVFTGQPAGCFALRLYVLRQVEGNQRQQDYNPHRNPAAYTCKRVTGRCLGTLLLNVTSCNIHKETDCIANAFCSKYPAWDAFDFEDLALGGSRPPVTKVDLYISSFSPVSLCFVCFETLLLVYEDLTTLYIHFSSGFVLLRLYLLSVHML